MGYIMEAGGLGEIIFYPYSGDFMSQIYPFYVVACSFHIDLKMAWPRLCSEHTWFSRQFDTFFCWLFLSTSTLEMNMSLLWWVDKNED